MLRPLPPSIQEGKIKPAEKKKSTNETKPAARGKVEAFTLLFPLAIFESGLPILCFFPYASTARTTHSTTQIQFSFLQDEGDDTKAFLPLFLVPFPLLFPAPLRSPPFVAAQRPLAFVPFACRGPK
jgi:hypothetical protein